jgi:hypothetical protein
MDDSNSADAVIKMDDVQGFLLAHDNVGSNRLVNNPTFNDGVFGWGYWINAGSGWNWAIYPTGGHGGGPFIEFNNGPVGAGSSLIHDVFVNWNAANPPPYAHFRAMAWMRVSATSIPVQTKICIWHDPAPYYYYPPLTATSDCVYYTVPNDGVWHQFGDGSAGRPLGPTMLVSAGELYKSAWRVQIDNLTAGANLDADDFRLVKIP